MSGDADGKFGKHMANKATRRLVKADMMDEGVVGKPPAVKSKKNFLIEEREYIHRGCMDWDIYARKGHKAPFWTEWRKHKAYEKRNARDRALEQIVKQYKHENHKYSYMSERENRPFDLKK